MADYHIYLHGDGLNNKSETTPYQSYNMENDGDIPFNPNQYVNVAKNVAKGNGINMGVSALSKVAPWTIAAIVAAKVTDKVLTIGFAHQEEYTGNYINDVNYNNFKAQVHAYTHPIQTAFSLIHQQSQFNKYNKAIEQQNTLIGNSILKDFNIGV